MLTWSDSGSRLAASMPADTAPMATTSTSPAAAREYADAPMPASESHHRVVSQVPAMPRDEPRHGAGDDGQQRLRQEEDHHPHAVHAAQPGEPDLLAPGDGQLVPDRGHGDPADHQQRQGQPPGDGDDLVLVCAGAGRPVPQHVAEPQHGHHARGDDGRHRDQGQQGAPSRTGARGSRGSSRAHRSSTGRANGERSGAGRRPARARARARVRAPAGAPAGPATGSATGASGAGSGSGGRCGGVASGAGSGSARARPTGALTANAGPVLSNGDWVEAWARAASSCARRVRGGTCSTSTPSSRAKCRSHASRRPGRGSRPRRWRRARPRRAARRARPRLPSSSSEVGSSASRISAQTTKARGAGDALHLAAGQLLDLTVAEVGDVEAGQRRLGALVGLGRRDPPGPQGDRDVLARRQDRHQAVDLEHERHRVTWVAVALPHRAAAVRRDPRRRLQEAAGDREQRGLAGAARTRDRRDLAGRGTSGSRRRAGCARRHR